VSKDDLPLYILFMRLRDAGFPLGTTDYNLLLEVLLADCHTFNRGILELLTKPSSVKNLCQTLWVKTASQRLLFEEIFNEVFSEISFGKKNIVPKKEQSLSSKSQHQEEKPTSTATSDLDTKQQEQETQIDEHRGNYFFFPPAPSPDLEASTEDLNKVVKAVRTVNPHEWVSFKPSGIQNEFFPVTAQQMQQSWYSLRRSTREGLRLELDVAATIEQTKRLGKFFYPIQRPRVNKSGQLVLFIDQKGSMQPFHSLSGLLVETALKSGCLEKTGCYYFKNYPRGVLYNDPQFQTESSVEEAIKRFNPNRTVVLIFSDAGAARGNFLLRRIHKTFDFLEQLQQHSQALAWLNPVPQNYWQGTTAKAIADANILKMFPADYSGFQNAIGVLQ
jgi:uncharacterized protein